MRRVNDYKTIDEGHSAYKAVQIYWFLRDDRAIIVDPSWRKKQSYKTGIQTLVE